MSGPAVILASRSPRREKLLRQLLPNRRIHLLPPEDDTEDQFEPAMSLDKIDEQVRRIARAKNHQVEQMVFSKDLAEVTEQSVILSADTVIVAFDEENQPVVLPKPPRSSPEHEETVRFWFREYYAGKTHLAKTALCLSRRDGLRAETLVTSRVSFRSDAVDYVDWYLKTGEPAGKAGGYAIQGAGSLFVERIEGSLSNIIGLPSVETLQLLKAMEIDDEPL